MALDADPDAIRVESAALGVDAPAPGGNAGRLLGELPGGAWLAGATPALGKQFDQQLRQFSQLGAFGGVDLEQILGELEKQTGIDVREDLLSWMGDAGVFVQGKDLASLSGALVVRSTDPQKTQEVVPQLGRTIRRLVPGVSVRRLTAGPDVDEGLTLSFAQLPLPVHIAAKGDRFVIAATDAGLEAALDPQERLGASAVFREAGSKLEGGVPPSFFLDMGPVNELVASSGALQEREADRVRRVLDQLTAVVAGGKREGDVQRGRLVVGVK
jgi:hypothetical protein